MSNNISTLGFNGEYLDDILDNYHLGNGYRAYNPTTMQFTAPDDMSPFGKGGINPYVYVSCDPINNTDPTGHFLGMSVTIGGLLRTLFPMLPKNLGFHSIIEAGEENIMNASIDEGIDAVIGLVSAGIADPAIPELNVMLAPVEHLAERPVEREARQGAEDYLTSAAGSSRGTARQELSGESESESESEEGSTFREDEDFTNLIQHRQRGRSSPAAVNRVRIAAKRAIENMRVYVDKRNTRFLALHEDDFLSQAYYINKTERNVIRVQLRQDIFYTNLQPYIPKKKLLDYFEGTTGDNILSNRTYFYSATNSHRRKARYQKYLFYKLSDEI